MKKLIAIAPLLIMSSLAHQNKLVKTNRINITVDNLPSEFSGFKIAQLSDIHCNKIGTSDLNFIRKIKKFNPDIIFITGDVLDSYNNDMDIVHNILSQLSTIAPCYFTSGNHELRMPVEYNKLKDILKKLNIIDLNNKSLQLRKENSSINLVGIEDYNYFKLKDILNAKNEFENTLKNLYIENKINILLSHRPEKINLYSKIGYDLVFSGHAHGGQWRIPFIGAIFAPSQGFFPKYTHGVYKENKTQLIVSQGLGNSSFPLRINNRKELILVTLS